MTTVIPVLLSGGGGTRLWPKSRKHYPKQLHRLYGEYTMLQHTALRVRHLAPPIVVCNDEQRFMVADQLSQVLDQQSTIMLEPVARNTAPAIVAAAQCAMNRDPEAIIAVFPADHLIQNEAEFKCAIELAILTAQSGKLVTFGIEPTHPETGYGYIKTESVSGESLVEKFVEKPDRATAEKYVTSGDYYWNSGMFVFSARALLDEMALYHPALVKAAVQSVVDAREDLDFVRLSEGSFSQCDDISIDYAVMEKTEKAWLVPLDAKWSDVGSWESLWAVSEKDRSGNVFEGDVLAEDVGHCFVSAVDGRLVALLGVEDLVVVDTSDCVMVASKSRSQDVKELVERLKAEGRSEYTSHREVYRPWGSYDAVDGGDRYQVKRITVKPGASLSLQKHHHRAEHWIVVAGTALVQRGDEEILLSENQSTYIPLGEIHRLTNPGKIYLHLIEVQSGSYLKEDDIIRLGDVFGRT